MNKPSDSQLLRAYAGHRSEAAFSEIVRRHIDLVHSAAVRIVGDPHLAEDISQAVFVTLAKNAGKLAAHPVLSGWLHRTTRNIAMQTIRTDSRRRAREHEAVMNDSSEAEAPWAEIAPQLDAAIGELAGPDRDAIILRYFENKPAQEMAATLGISAEAAQKRVSRAVEKLRTNFAKRGITVGTGLAGTISANAVQPVPLGFASKISAAALTGRTSASTLALSPLRKLLIASMITVTAGVVIYFASTAMNPEQELASQKQPALRKSKNPRPSQEDSPVTGLRRTRSKKPANAPEDLANIHWPKVLIDLPPITGEPSGGDAELATDRYEIIRRRSTDPETLIQGGSGGHMVEIELRDTKSSWSSISIMQSEGGRLLEDYKGRPQIENWGRGGGGYWTRSLYRYISGEYQRVRTDEFLEWSRPDIENNPTTEPPFAPHGEDDDTGKLLYFVETRIPDL